MKQIKRVAFFITVIGFLFFIDSPVFAKDITVGDADADILWSNSDVLKDIIKSGDFITIVSPPKNNGENHTINICADDVTIQSDGSFDLKGVNIRAENISNLTLKDLRLYSLDGTEMLGIYADECFAYYYQPSSRMQQKYSDPNPCTVYIEGSVKLDGGYQGDKLSMNNLQTAIYTNVSLEIAGNGILEIAGASGSQTGAHAIYSQGNVTLRANVSAKGGSADNGDYMGGYGISCGNDLNIYSDCDFTGGESGGKGVNVRRNLNVFENATLRASGANSEVLGGDGAYVYGAVNIEGDVRLKGGDSRSGRGGAGLYVYYDNLNTTGSLQAVGGNTSGKTPIADVRYEGGHGIFVNLGNVNLNGSTAATGGDAPFGVGGSGVITLQKDVNLFGSLDARGGSGKKGGVVSYGSGVYLDNRGSWLVFRDINANASIIDGINCKPPATGLSIKIEHNRI